MAFAEWKQLGLLNEQTQLIGELTAQVREANVRTAEAITKAPGQAMAVYSGSRGAQSFQRNANIPTLREYAKGNPFVAAAIRIYRDTISQAEWQLVPIDKERRVDRTAEKAILKLLRNPNPMNESYVTLKEAYAEDYLVGGYGVFEKELNKAAYPIHLWLRDAARWGFFPGWDGREPTAPRYAYDETGKQGWKTRANAQGMVLVNRRVSYAPFGQSQVEELLIALEILRAMDDYSLENTTNPTASRIVNLGAGYTQPQLDALRAQMDETRKLVAFVSAPKGLEEVALGLSEGEVALWKGRAEMHIRQVAAVFRISTAALRLAVDTSRANTQAMLDEDMEGPAALLRRMAEIENSEIVGAFGTPEELNLKIEYPILSQRDAEKEAKITTQAMGGRQWMTLNAAQQRNGLPMIELPIADQILVTDGKALIPLAALNERYFDASGNLKPEAAAPPATAASEPQGEGETTDETPIDDEQDNPADE